MIYVDAENFSQTGHCNGIILREKIIEKVSFAGF